MTPPPDADLAPEPPEGARCEDCGVEWRDHTGRTCEEVQADQERAQWP